jgi:hypothetical protein
VGSWVAAWLSETVLRGRGPGASGFESHRRGRIFSKEGTFAGPWMCVYDYQGLTVGWWKVEERHSSDATARAAGFESRPDGPPMDVMFVVFVLCRPEKEKGEERMGVGGRGKYPGAPPHHIRKKEKKNQADRKVPDRPVVVKGQMQLKKKQCLTIKHLIMLVIFNTNVVREVFSDAPTNRSNSSPGKFTSRKLK